MRVMSGSKPPSSSTLSLKLKFVSPAMLASVQTHSFFTSSVPFVRSEIRIGTAPDSTMEDLRISHEVKFTFLKRGPYVCWEVLAVIHVKPQSISCWLYVVRLQTRIENQGVHRTWISDLLSLRSSTILLTTPQRKTVSLSGSDFARIFRNLMTESSCCSGESENSE
jgi:hypothetical protein